MPKAEEVMGILMLRLMAEIRRVAPVDMVNNPFYLQGFIHTSWLALGFLNPSTVGGVGCHFLN